MRSSTPLWVAVHIVMPLLPFLAAGLVRLLFDPGDPSWRTFSASELTFSLAIVVAFLQQSIVGKERILDNADKREEVMYWAVCLGIGLIVLVALFTVIVALNTLVDDSQPRYETPLRVVEGTAFAVFPVVIWSAVAAQRNFELKASVL